ncbi:hydroxyacid dehydrogenase [Arthrobacter sp. MYb221]|uniref:NAD(P)-dependent oxidoreductase n=1 Tax=unclassified Arthrobacter TaxID=235627 RepID=UPI000D4E8E6A|nr:MULTISPECIES: NAD(P)-dependent oxidoreductase [unclassified Arthrobacter]PRA10624.1 hydroxyacid dehydrogenase [Arthrobacter sp. MYb221]
MSRLAPLFKELGPEHDWEFVAHLSPAEQSKHVSMSDVLVCSKLNSEDAAQCPARLVHVTGAGTDRVALASLPSSTLVARTAHHERSIAEHVLMVILAHQRRLFSAAEELRQGSWRSVSTAQAVPLHRTFRDLTIGFIGLGGIGEQALEFTTALGASAIAVRRTPLGDRHPNPQLRWVKGLGALPELLRDSDVVVLGLPLTDETRGLIGEKELTHMRDDALLVNVSRGEIVNASALYAALADGTIGGAALDVWWGAPYGSQAPAEVRRFAALPNVIATPHYSGHAVETFEKRVREITSNINAFAGELPLSNKVEISPNRRRQRKGGPVTTSSLRSSSKASLQATKLNALPLASTFLLTSAEPLRRWPEN